MKQALYSCAAVETLIRHYIDHNGDVLTIDDGCLGYGLTILTGYKLKTAVIKEVYINQWQSAHKIRLYNKLPAKYVTMIDNYYDRLEKEEV